jgi:hypothetical protein
VVQCLNAGSPGIPLHPAAVADFETARIAPCANAEAARQRQRRMLVASEAASAHGGD